MNLYPAIDLYEGQVVRLEKGDFAKKTVYNADPVAQARLWEEQGAKWIHIVDLEGAKTGVFKNLASLIAIRGAVKCPIEFGGGVRSLEDIQTLANEGINRIVLGTKALEGDFFERAMAWHGDKIAVGLDVRDGLVQTQGWLEASGARLENALAKFNQYPLETVIYTDIKKDGMLSGPNWEGLQEVMSLSRAKVILSGGISHIDDIKKAAELNDKRLEGVIIGKALYEKKFALRDALKFT